MNLIEAFNGFQSASERLRLSANARSLYYALLAEFNKQQYPESLLIGNALLQHLSGINSSHSFDSARAALINAGVISYRKQIYSLTAIGEKAEKVGKEAGKSKESPKAVLVMPTKVEKEKEREETAPSATRAREIVKELDTWKHGLATEIREVWFLCEDEALKGANAHGLYNDQQIYGVDIIVEAIRKASQCNKSPRLTYQYVHRFIENAAKGKAYEVGGVEYGGVDEYNG